jgi:hypothetical protein
MFEGLHEPCGDALPRSRARDTLECGGARGCACFSQLPIADIKHLGGCAARPLASTATTFDRAWLHHRHAVRGRAPALPGDRFPAGDDRFPLVEVDMDSASALMSIISTTPTLLSSDAGGPAREANLAASNGAAQKPTTRYRTGTRTGVRQSV